MQGILSLGVTLFVALIPFFCVQGNRQSDRPRRTLVSLVVEPGFILFNRGRSSDNLTHSPALVASALLVTKTDRQDLALPATVAAALSAEDLASAYTLAGLQECHNGHGFTGGYRSRRDNMGLAAHHAGVVPTFLGAAAFGILLMSIVRIVPGLQVSIDFYQKRQFRTGAGLAVCPKL